MTAQRGELSQALDFGQRYEELRRSVLGGTPICSSSLGISVLIRHGLTGWMLAWAKPDVDDPARDVGGSGCCLPSGDRLHREIVCVLVNMALASEEAA